MTIVIDGTTGISGVDGTASNPSYEGTDSNTGIFFPAADTVAIGTGGTEALRVNSSQNVGIGTQSPTTILNIEKSAPSASVDVLVRNTGTDGTSNARIMSFVSSASGGDPKIGVGITGVQDYFWYIDNSDSDKLKLDSNGSDLLTVTSGGNLGIGTSSPSVRLHSVNSGDNVNYFERTSGSRFLIYNSSGDSYIGTTTNTPLRLATNDTERARITSGGDLLVGATSSFGTGLLQVQSATAGQMSLRHSSASAGAHWRIGPDSSANDLIVYSSSTGGVFITNTGTSWSGRSDERLKDIIEPITNAANKVLSLRAVIGKFKVDKEGTRRSFLIAQDVQAVLPEAVSISPREEGEDTDYLGVAYTDVIPLLVAAIKEQQAIITQLQADVTALKGNA